MTTTGFTIHILVIPGHLSMGVEVVEVREKAVALRNTESPDARGRAWIPRSVLELDPDRSYGAECVAYRMKPGFARRLDLGQRRALGMLA